MKTFGTGKQVVVIVGLSIVATLFSVAFHPKRPSWYRVSSPEELRWQILPAEIAELSKNDEILWVDAREREKFEVDHMQGAILLNLGEWGDLMFQHMDILQSAFSRPVVVYCDTETCGKSQEVAKRLRELIGLEPVYVLKGSWRELGITPES
ncbi:MAG: rhodanese-like domain-containing protein [Verrucomicrobiales bacterium]|nr:rhodanese-like domain-containing protein [Verrucomicrobiales bacterium]